MSKNTKPTKNSTTSLSKQILVIDNEPLKREALKQAGIWLQKIKTIEITTQRFNEVDLKLYTDWFNLSIQPLQADIERVRADFLREAREFNMLVFISHRKKISLPEAFIFLQEEEARYQAGDEKTRKTIEQQRAKRNKDLERETNPGFHGDDDDLEDELREEFQRNAGFDSDSEDSEDDIDEDKIRNEATQVEQAREKFKKQIEYYKNISDERIAKAMQYFDDGVEFVVTAIRILTQTSHPELLKRIWRLTPSKIKKHLNKNASENTGITFDDLINDLGDRHKEREEFFESKSSKKEKSERGGFRNQLNEDRLLRLKSLYRKIVRRIHPDNFKSDETPELKMWFDTIWQSVMKAYQKDDVEGLQGLHNKIILVMNEHQELSVSEVYSAADSLKSEYEQLKEKYEDLKQSPAWNFSSLKDYGKIEKKVFRPYRQQKQILQDELSDLRGQQSEIERIAGLLRKGSLRIQSGRTSRAGKSSSGRGHAGQRRRKGRGRG